jgi:outer membrane protein OmpA-like peptidoglycan-associated protein
MSWRRIRIPTDELWDDFHHRRETESQDINKALPLPPQHSREGERLSPEARRKLESSFGADLDDIRIHQDEDAQRSAGVLGADAYTHGRDIYFAPGKYGEELLAHEVAHTLQQADAVSPASVENASLEAEARDAASNTLLGKSAEIARGQVAPAMQRQKTAGASEPEDSKQSPVHLLPSRSVTIDDFDSDQAVLKPAHQRTLDELARKLVDTITQSPDTFITITGHTDATDSEQHNTTLGQRRAEAVRDFLVSRGVPAEALHAASLGETMLKVNTQQAEPRNRRVEIDIHERSFRIRIPSTVLPQKLEPPKPPEPPPKPIDLYPKREVHIPTKEEEAAENFHHNEELWEKAQEIKKKEAEEAERHPPGVSLSDYFGSKARDVAKSLGLPKWIQDKAADLARDLPAKGLQTIFNQIATDRNMDDKAKEAVKKVLEALPQMKVK